MRNIVLKLSLVLLLGVLVMTYASQIGEIYSKGLPAPEQAALTSAIDGRTILSLAPAAFAPEKVDAEDILDKAVFEPTRSRPQPEPEPEPLPEPELLQEPQPEVVDGPEPLLIKILGIVLQGDTGVVIFQSVQGGQPEQAAVGDEIDGWKLVNLTSFMAVFKQDGEETRLRLALD